MYKWSQKCLDAKQSETLKAT